MKTANNYLNKVFVDVVSPCLQDLQKQCPPTVPTRKALTCCNFLPACEKSFLTRKEYAICRSLQMQYPTEIKLKLNLLVWRFLRNRNSVPFKKSTVFKKPKLALSHFITVEPQYFLESPVRSDNSR